MDSKLKGNMGNTVLTPRDSPYPPPSHDSYGQTPQHGYGAPPSEHYQQSYDPNRSTSPYPPPAHQQQGYNDPNQQYGGHQQVGYHDPNQQHGAHQQQGYQDQQQGYGAPQYGQPGAPGGPADGDRGLGSTLIGGAGGAFVGNKLGGGAMGAVGGALLGAVAANFVSDK
ncbi:DUF4175 domain containing protein [Pyrenophora tritici-repentis]|nr:DUF4175 domain containing protein [Pyrenophora tritici-repentis]PZD24557.1 DUF4175 domain containing protein [Pyrenophora tritici-repentis]